jgi:hypothetical protein
VTIAGTGSSQTGFRVWSVAPTAAQNSTGTLTNSVISGLDEPISRRASNDGTPGSGSQANVTVAYSNYDAAANLDLNGANGSGAITVNPRAPSPISAPASSAVVTSISRRARL